MGIFNGTNPILLNLFLSLVSFDLINTGLNKKIRSLLT